MTFTLAASLSSTSCYDEEADLTANGFLDDQHLVLNLWAFLVQRQWASKISIGPLPLNWLFLSTFRYY